MLGGGVRNLFVEGAYVDVTALTGVREIELDAHGRGVEEFLFNMFEFSTKRIEGSVPLLILLE